MFSSKERKIICGILLRQQKKVALKGNRKKKIVFTGGGRIKHVRVLLGVPTLQILRFKKKKKFEKANKARTCFIRLFELFGKFFQSQFFFDFFFAQEVILLHFRANPGLWWGIYGKMDKISAT